ncbi:MAG: asnB [Frankiales bacterium]|nr:asnB [Frankiales bacterium]
MCGIVGVRRLDGAAVEVDALRRMTDVLAHRGPDGEGFWTQRGTGFGHRRLAIIDVAGSPQPMSLPDGTLTVCFNGEIFNYRELRRRLGARWRTEGDTEVLLALFAAHGPQGVERLRGQFAYAIADSRDGSLWLFRDRLGVLPLYYARTSAAFVFGSEAKAVLAALPGPPSVDEDSLSSYLARRSVPAPATLFRGVSKLLPGSWLHLAADGSQRVHRWWEAPALDDVSDLSPQEAVRQVRAGLDRAVSRALVADVPVGSYLSGGVDSSLVVALAAEQRGAADLHTFAAGFDDPRTDELRHARVVSEHLGTRHHEVIVRPDDFLADWGPLTVHRDAPLSEPADIAVHRLAVAASEHVKVVLSGEGSDELFAGYPKHRWALAADRAGHLPWSLRSPLSAVLDERLPLRLHRLRIAARALGAPGAVERDLSWFSPFTARERSLLLGTALPSRASGGGDPLRRMMRADLATWLPDNLLERGDRMTMAASVELRPPFLDADLVETALRLPASTLLHAGTTKWVVKQVASELLPAQIVHRPKAGFRVPLDQWFRTGLADMARERLLGAGSYVGQVMDRTAVSRLLDVHASGRRNEDIRLWTLLALEVWHDVCITGPSLVTSS